MLTAPPQGLAVGTAGPVEPSRDILSTGGYTLGSHNSATPETRRLVNHNRTQTPEPIPPPVSPRQSSPSRIPPVLEQEYGGEPESPVPARTVSTNPTTNNTLVTVLHAVNPENGPTSGGQRISLYVSNLDPGTTVYPRFGRNVGHVAVRRFESNFVQN